MRRCNIQNAARYHVTAAGVRKSGPQGDGSDDDKGHETGPEGKKERDKTDREQTADS